MKTADSKELQEELKAVPNENTEGELNDDGAAEVTGGAYYPPKKPQQPPVPIV